VVFGAADPQVTRVRVRDGASWLTARVRRGFWLVLLKRGAAGGLLVRAHARSGRFVDQVAIRPPIA